MKKKLKLSSLIALVLAINFVILVGYAPAKVKTPVKPVTTKTKAVQKSTTTKKTTVPTKPTKPKTPAKKVVPAKPVKPTKPATKPVTTPAAIVAQPKADTQPMGLFYKVKAGDATVYILGSMHITKPDMFPFNKVVENAFDSSKNLVVEADITDTNAIMKLQNRVYYGTNDDIYKHLSDTGKERYDALVKMGAMDVNTVKTIRTWAFGSSLMTGIATAAGYGPGVDSYFLGKAKGKKTILELEGLAFQFDMMDSLSDLDQENSFIPDMKELQATVPELNTMYDNYKAGDDKALTQSLLKENPKLSADYTKKFYTDRNIGMAEKIDGYLKTKDTYFVIAGAAHFLGDSSVLDLLTKKGYVIERIK